MRIPQDMAIGSIHKSNSGVSFKVTSYRGCNDVSIKFLDTGFVTTATTGRIRSGAVKDMLSPLVCGVGFVGVGDFKATEGGKITLEYRAWSGMIKRCYGKEKRKEYANCIVCDEWHNFQEFAKWYVSQKEYGLGYELDKDKRGDGIRKIYSPDTCCLISAKENTQIARQRKCDLVSPAGEIVHVINLSKFCRDNNLCQPHMSNVVNGSLGQHKGWKKAE
ncbi:hypothetical protein NVP1167O_24 [Vibrio phage 1.167.O._10N.261.51.F2]|nr:hypothetical protein NVP1167O_24 [Vibrio phage 1.167.O._10N.261.51.F2]